VIISTQYVQPDNTARYTEEKKNLSLLSLKHVIIWKQPMEGHILKDDNNNNNNRYSALGPVWQEPEPSQATGMALIHCNLGKFLEVACHCFPQPLDVPTFATRCLPPGAQRQYFNLY
jgi:hypothetical protein